MTPPASAPPPIFPPPRFLTDGAPGAAAGAAPAAGGRAGAGLQLAPGGPYVPENVLDGDAGTGWFSARWGTSKQWLTFDLGAAVRVRGLQVGMLSDRAHAARRCSLEGFTGPDFGAAAARGAQFALAQGREDELQRFDAAGLDRPVRYVRLNVHDNHGSERNVCLGRVVFMV